jgi:peroxiredoxin Q/BCP
MNAFRLQNTELLVVAAAIASLSACATQRGGAGPGRLLAPGMNAPDFEASDASGAALRLSQVKGRFAVVYFYPKDETPGCTKEACAFRDSFERFQAAGVAIFAVSRDSTASHRNFREHHHLPFAMAADESGSVQQSYGVPSRFGLASRVTFLVGRDGKVARVYPEVNPALHADEVLAAVKQLSSSSS